MSFAAPAGGGGIDIANSVRDAYTVVIENARVALDLAWLPFAILVGAEIVALLLGGGGWFGHILALLVRGLGFLVFGTAFIVRWHRFILLGETTAEGLLPPGWGGFVLAAVKVGASAGVGYIVVVLIAAMPPHYLTGALAIIGALAVAFATPRVSLVFPAAAVEQPMSLREAWVLMTGNHWQLLVCLVLCYLPFGIAHYVLGKIGLALPSVLWILFQVLGLAVSFAAVAVVAALLSDLYRTMAPATAPAGRLSA